MRNIGTRKNRSGNLSPDYILQGMTENILAGSVKRNKKKSLKFDPEKGINTECSINYVRTIWLNGKALKGIVDIDNEILYMKPLVWMPVYTEDLMAVWRNTPEMHRNGMPKKVEFRDSSEIPQRIDYLDQNERLTFESRSNCPRTVLRKAPVPFPDRGGYPYIKNDT